MANSNQHARVYLPMIALRCSDGAFRVYVAVLAHLNRHTQETYVSDKTLAEVCGMPKRTVQRHLTELVEAGHLVRGGTTRRRTISATAGANTDPIDARIDANPEPISATAGASPESISAISCIEHPSISATGGALTVKERTISPPQHAHARGGLSLTDPHMRAAYDILHVHANATYVAGELHRHLTDIDVACWADETWRFEAAARVLTSSRINARGQRSFKTYMGCVRNAEREELDIGKPVAAVPAGSSSVPMSKHDRRRIEEEAGWEEFDRQIKGGVA